MAMNQKLWGPRSALALAVSEAAPDHFYMRRCGMQIAIPEPMIEERVAARKNSGLAPFSKDELKAFRAPTVGRVMLLRGRTGEELLGALLKFFDEGIFDILCLDSVSAVLPEADAGKDLDENQKRAAAAGLLTKFFQHYLNGTTGYSSLNKTTVIFTSQVRSNSKKAEAPAHIQKYLPDYAPQGAWAAKHGKLIDILVKPGEKEKEKTNVEVTTLGAAVEQRKKTVQIGKSIRYEILKGKAGVHEGITGEFPFNYDTITDDQRMIVLSALRLGVAEERNGVITFYDLKQHSPIPGLEKLPIDKIVEMLRANFDLEYAIRLMLLASVGVECPRGSEVALVMSVTSEVQRDKMDLCLPASTPVFEIAWSNPSLDCLRAPSELAEFVLASRDVMEKIHRVKATKVATTRTLSVPAPHPQRPMRADAPGRAPGTRRRCPRTAV
jgi:hypothetical protein